MREFEEAVPGPDGFRTIWFQYRMGSRPSGSRTRRLHQIVSGPICFMFRGFQDRNDSGPDVSRAGPDSVRTRERVAVPDGLQDQIGSVRDEVQGQR